MTGVEVSIFPLLVFSLHFSYIKSVPSEYCLSSLNLSDCGRPPTPVFSYWKAASRCEIEMWRGCSSNNMFDNEYQCVDLCVGRTNNFDPDNFSGKGRFSITIDHLNIYELEEIYRILNEMEREKHKIADRTPEPDIHDHLKNKSPIPANLATSSEYEISIEYLTPYYRTLDPELAKHPKVYIEGENERLMKLKKLKELNKQSKLE